MTELPRHRTVADVMTSRLHIATAATPFKVLVQLIEDNKVSAVPIVDEQGFPIGIVSESDLLFKERRVELESTSSRLHPLRSRKQRAKAVGLVASEIMTSPPITVASDMTLPRAARLMQERNVRRLVVVTERGKIAGIVSRSDLLQVFLRTDDELRDEVKLSLIPSVLPDAPDAVEVTVRWNVVTLTGELDRKTDTRILVRLARELDGVVEVVDHLRFRWDDAVAHPLFPGPLEAGYRAF